MTLAITDALGLVDWIARVWLPVVSCDAPALVIVTTHESPELVTAKYLFGSPARIEQEVGLFTEMVPTVAPVGAGVLKTKSPGPSAEVSASAVCHERGTQQRTVRQKLRASALVCIEFLDQMRGCYSCDPSAVANSCAPGVGDPSRAQNEHDCRRLWPMPAAEYILYPNATVAKRTVDHE